MRSVLGRKQRSNNADWLEAFAHIEDIVAKDELERLTEQTLAEIRKNTEGKKAAYAWSGGKDSLVLGELCRMAGIAPCVLVRCDLEYPAFLEWLEAHKPPELTVLNTGQGMEWLTAHPEMLFPKESRIAAQWFRIVQHRGQTRYYRENQLDILLLGRRRADGNYVGKGGNLYTDRQGVTRYSPLADWTHEQVLAFLHYHRLEMPPIYEWKNGFVCGTHPWPARQCTGSLENAWSEIHEIDPSIVEGAAGHFQSARDFLVMQERFE